MLGTLVSVLTQIYAVPCGDVGTPACEASFSVGCSPIGCLIVLLPAGIVTIAIRQMQPVFCAVGL